MEIQEKDVTLVVQNQTIGTLVTNANQIKDFVKTILPNYDISKYSEDNIEEAKKDKATINTASKALNDKRIAMEKEFMQPFTEVKDIIAETIKLMGECSGKIDTVVKTSEQKAKDAKKALITEWWSKMNFTLVKLEQIFDEKWLNKGSKDKDIRMSIQLSISKIKNDLETLEAIESDTELLKSMYLTNLDLGTTIKYANQLKQKKEALEKIQPTKVTFTGSGQVDIFPTEQSPTVIPTHTIPELHPEIPDVVLSTAMETLTRAFKVTGTRQQIIDLSTYMNTIGLHFEKIEP